MSEAATTLGVSRHRIRRLIEHGIPDVAAELLAALLTVPSDRRHALAASISVAVNVLA
jgi:hypothetical protein